MNEILRKARKAAVNAKIALRHAENDAGDYLIWFDGQNDYTALGKNDTARKKAHAELLAADKRAVELELAVRDAEDTKDRSDLDLEIALDDVKEGRDRTWAILAEWVKGRSASGRMRDVSHAGEEMLREQVEDCF